MPFGASTRQPTSSSRSRAAITTRPAQGRRPYATSSITAASIISRSASGSAIFPKCDSTCQARARKPSTWSVTPATPKTMPAGQLGPPSAWTIRTTKTGMRTSLLSVSAFGSCASGAGTARVAIGASLWGAQRLPQREAVERVRERGPVERARQIGVVRRRARHAPGSVVGAVAGPPRRGLDLRALAPFVVARDRHEVRLRLQHGIPERVVRLAVRPLAPDGSLAGAAPVVAGADARGAEQPHGVRLAAEARELVAGVRDEVVRVEAVEVAGRGEAGTLGSGE